MTLVFVLIVVTVMLMMIQKLVRVPPDEEAQFAPATDAPDRTPALAKLRTAVQLLVTVLGLVGGGYVVLYGDYPVEARYWAAGLMGSVFGFWLK